MCLNEHVKEVADLPVISNWSPEKLGRILGSVILDCIIKSLSDNKGAIFTTLSGGLDSSLCLAIIKDFLRGNIPVYAFTLGQSLKHPDVHYAMMIASTLNIKHRVLIPSPDEISEASSQAKNNIPGFEKLHGSNIGTYLLYEYLAGFGAKTVIAHDGIDELMGGYWEHRKYAPNKEKMSKVFNDFWGRLAEDHLIPLERIAESFGIKVIFPYLQEEVVRYISHIPLDERTSREESKIPLRRIAEKYLPPEIIKRKKLGLVHALARWKI